MLLCKKRRERAKVILPLFFLHERCDKLYVTSFQLNHFFFQLFFFFLTFCKHTMSDSTPTVSTETIQPAKSSILKCLVIDTNAIINGVSLRTMAEEFYTCPEVLYELRSAHSKEFLSRLPFELKILNPTEESMKTSRWMILLMFLVSC